MLPTIQIGPYFIVPVYLLMISLYFTAAIFWLMRRADQRSLDPRVALDLILILMISGFFGARLFHIFYENWSYYARSPMMIFKVWQGGFTFYGGFLAAWMCGRIYLWRRKEAPAVWYDLFAPILAAGYSVGRLGCFSAGCCYGKATEVPWAFAIPAVDSLVRHPTQLYAFFWESLLCVAILLLERKKFFSTRPGSIFFVWLLSHAVGRILMETFRDDPRGAMWFQLSISTWISFALIGYSIFNLRRLSIK